MDQNPRLFKFRPHYFLLAILILFIEILIALYVNDAIIRPYFGDVLVVVLLYCLIKSFLNTPVVATAIGVLLFSYGIEVLQYFQYVKWLGLQHSKVATIILGNSFAWTDLFAYSIGIALVLLTELKPGFKKQEA